MVLDQRHFLRQKLEDLRTEHRDLDRLIAELMVSGSALDQLQLQRCKKRKLLLKDQISKLESLLLDDIIA
ncbi:MAG: YdcH family protein [Dongiaceae bacterium]